MAITTYYLRSRRDQFHDTGLTFKAADAIFDSAYEIIGVGLRCAYRSINICFYHFPLCIFLFSRVTPAPMFSEDMGTAMI